MICEISSITSKYQSKYAKLIIGRFQPFTDAHRRMIKTKRRKMIVGIIKGKQSSLDKSKNPFNFIYQKYLIEKAIDNVLVIELKNGFLPEAIIKAREYGYEIDKFICGSDREKDYTRQLGYFTNIKNEYPEFNIPYTKLQCINRTEDDISATKVREAILNDDIETFKLMMPYKLHNDYELIKTEMKRVLKNEI